MFGEIDEKVFVMVFFNSFFGEFDFGCIYCVFVKRFFIMKCIKD